LCHPFLVHAAQRHRGSVPRFMAQQSLGLRGPYRLDREHGAYSAVEVSIRKALEFGDGDSGL
ncbi:MAG: phytanoyl-CoA dioxygenase, partial [Steroidobacteraceae bacterium]